MHQSNNPNFFQLTTNESFNLTKIEKVKQMLLKKVKAKATYYDTLFLFKPVWQKPLKK